MKTKRQTSIALLLSASMLTACAGGAGDIISDFKDRKNAEYVHVPKMLMKIGKINGAIFFLLIKVLINLTNEGSEDDFEQMLRFILCQG